MLNKIIKIINNSKVYDVVKVSKLELANKLSTKFANNIYLKREDNSDVFSFKIRGAYQKIANLTKEQKLLGVISSSAGNHAQGVAFSAKKLTIQATIVMPINTTQIKIDAVKNLGAKVILKGDVYDDCYNFAKKLAEKNKLAFIHPYDDLDVIAGQGTIAKELLQQLENIDYIFIPVGGGGLISGISSYIKHYHANIKIIAVEPEDTPTMHNTLKTKKRIVLQDVGRFADGVAVKQIGKLPFIITKNLIDDAVLVTNDEICAAIKDIYDDSRAITEPSGALAIAGIKKYIQQHNINKKNIISIVSGGNINFNNLRYVAERAELGEQNEVIFAVNINEKPGSFLNFCNYIKNYTITEFNYRFAAKDNAYVFVGISLVGSPINKKQLLIKLQQHFIAYDLSDNSIAKTHIRYMVGGRADTGGELLYRFEFPEKIGALLDFLTKISGKYNISLFHYRNHGSAYGRVLVGFQTNDTLSLEKILDKISYVYYNETNNEAYKYFL